MFGFVVDPDSCVNGKKPVSKPLVPLITSQTNALTLWWCRCSSGRTLFRIGAQCTCREWFVFRATYDRRTRRQSDHGISTFANIRVAVTPALGTSPTSTWRTTDRIPTMHWWTSPFALRRWFEWRNRHGNREIPIWPHHSVPKWLCKCLRFWQCASRSFCTNRIRWDPVVRHCLAIFPIRPGTCRSPRIDPPANMAQCPCTVRLSNLARACLSIRDMYF